MGYEDQMGMAYAMADLVERVDWAPGDMVVVPQDAPHTVELLSDSARLIDCFYPIREDFLS